MTNDDGVMADGLRALQTALLERGLDVVVVAPTENRSGIARNATYSEPVAVTAVDGDENVLACSGTPVDCVRAALLGDIAPDARLVLSGINHGANLGDDTLNSGTVGAAVEAALLGVPAIAVSQQSHPGFFHILDALDQHTPVYHRTAQIAAIAAERALGWSLWPERLILNLNVPAEIELGEANVEVTRLGRRFYEPGAVPRETRGYAAEYLTYGHRTAPAPRFEDTPGTDFGAIKAGNVSLSPLSYAWGEELRHEQMLAWAQAAGDDISEALAAEAAIEKANPSPSRR
jgi:5'-nucleotidase